MATRLLTIAEPGGARAAPFGPAPHGWPGLRLGFRPFYLAAALFAVVAMALWPAVFLGRVRPASGLAPTLWHAHEMIFGASPDAGRTRPRNTAGHSAIATTANSAAAR